MRAIGDVPRAESGASGRAARGVVGLVQPMPLMLFGLAMASALLGGCVRRTLRIDTDPQGAIVYLNDEEVGATPVSRDFLWYGDYDVVLRKQGYETVHTNIVVNPPWYQIPPIDFIADVLWPGEIHDQHHAAFELTRWTAPEHDEIVERALELRSRALATYGSRSGR